MKKQQSGFTMIELMIVVAIIGILASIAMPAYQDYTKRAHISEGITLAAAAKMGVTEYYAAEGAWPTSNSDVGLADKADIKGNAVDSVEVGANGLITVTFGNKVDSTAATTMLFQPTDQDGSIKWACGTPATGGVKNSYLPSACRNTITP